MIEQTFGGPAAVKLFGPSPAGDLGRAQAVRHTPIRWRAQEILTWFLRDVTDPGRLVIAPPVDGLPRGRRRVQYSARPLYGARQLPRFRSFRKAREFGARLSRPPSGARDRLGVGSGRLRLIPAGRPPPWLPR